MQSCRPFPRWFNIDAKGVATPNPDYLVSATETSQSPTVINFKLNPKAVWGDGSPIDIDDMIATLEGLQRGEHEIPVRNHPGIRLDH